MFEVILALCVVAIAASLLHSIARLSDELVRVREQLALSEQHLSFSQTARRVLREELDEAQARAALHAAERYAAEEREWQLRRLHAGGTEDTTPAVMAAPGEQTVRRKVGAL